MNNEIIMGDCAEVLKSFESESIDCIVTDPPYGYSFMGLEWDKALPSLEALKECCRVLKAGAFGFFMCAPRQDVLSRMIIRLEDAGFNVGFSSLYHCYASGFPKAANASKIADKRLGAKREVIGKTKSAGGRSGGISEFGVTLANIPKEFDITIPATPEAQALDGAYLGFQPKPALEVIITVMKPLSEKTYIDQALQNGNGVTWLGECMIPYENENDIWPSRKNVVMETGNNVRYGKYKKCDKLPDYHGRFPANLLVSDNCLDRGIITKSTGGKNIGGGVGKKVYGNYSGDVETTGSGGYKDSGDFSRYFSLDAWFDKKISELPEHIQKTFPFLITPKPSKSEKNKYIENKHPTVKPLKLMSYLITLGSREGDVILDPFAGSGTTLEAARLLNRQFIGIDEDESNKPLMEARGQLNTVTLNAFEGA